jgi:hypothetical protein
MLRKPAGSIIALVFEMFLCLVALCFIGRILECLVDADAWDTDRLFSTRSRGD